MATSKRQKIEPLIKDAPVLMHSCCAPCSGELIEALKSYCKRWDEKNNCFRNKPLHNWASHFCDSVRYGAIVEPVERSDWSKPIRVDTNYIV